MKKFLTIATAFVLMLCIGFLATGCTMKVAGKTFAYESITVEINTANLTTEEKTSLIANMNEMGMEVNGTMTDAQLTEKYNANSEIKGFMNEMLENLKTETMVCGKNTITYYENGVATEDKAYYKQDGKTITMFEDEALTVKLEDANGQTITVKDKKIVVTGEMEKGIFVSYILAQVK